MADGNIGSLWLSLGIRDAVSKELNRIADGMTGVDAKTKKAQESLRKLAEENPAGKNVAFLDKLKKAVGDSTKEAKELQAVFEAIRNIRGGFGTLTGGFGKKELLEYEFILRKIHSSLGKISFGGLSGTGEGIYAKIEAVKSAMNGLRKINAEINRLHETAPRSSPKEKAEYHQTLSPLFDIRSAGENYLRSGDLSKAYAWANSLDEQISKISSSYEKFLSSEKGVVESLKKEEEQSKKTTDATNEQTNALKKQEEQLKATSAAQREKSATESKAAVAPKGQPFVVDKGIEKMLSDATAAREKDAAATQTQIAYTKILNEVLDAFKGKASTLLGVKDDSGRKYVDILNEANAAIEKMNKARAAAMVKEGKDFNPANYPDPTPRIKKALEYLSLLQRIDIAQKHISEVKAANPNVDTKNIKEAAKLVENFRNKLLALQNDKYLTGADDAHILGAYRKALAMTLKDVDAIIGKLQKPNPLSDLDGNFSKLDARIDAVREKLAKLRDLMNEGTQKGYNTSMFGERISGLGGVVARMEAAMSNKNGELSNADKMKQLFNDISVEVNKASTAMQAYGREKAKVMAAEKERDSIISKANRVAAAERQQNETLARTEVLLRNIDTLIGRGTMLKVNTSDLVNARQMVVELQQKIESFSGGGLLSNGFKDSLSNLKETKAVVNQLMKEQSEANRRESKKVADATRQQVQEANRVAAAERQRQRELEVTRSRIQSMERALHNLQEKRFTAKMLGIDTSEANAKIEHLKTLLIGLRNIQLGLSMGDTSFLGRVGNLGNGREVQAANQLSGTYSRLIGEVEKTNREKEKSIELERAHQQEVARTAAKVRGDLAKAFEQAKNHSLGMNSTLQDLKSLFMQGGIVYGAQQFLMSVIQTGGELEKQHIALQSILGDMQNANTMFGQVKELALNSPFTFSELNKDVKQLAAYGVEYDELYDTTKRLADMASGLGVSFERIALAFGQVRSRGWLDGKELRQISYAGIPLLQKLSEYYSKREGRKVSTSEIKTRISGRGVDFEDVKNVFWEMTDAGGQFYNMQQVLSETLLGRYNKLKDAWEIMLSDFASGNNVVGKGLKGIIDLITELVQALHSMAPVVAAAFSGFAIKRLWTALGGGIGSALLSGKASMAADIQQRVLMGEKVSEQELRMLRTKKQITIEDLQALAAAKALSKAELDRMLITKSITPEMYKQMMAEMGLASRAWTLRGAWNGTLGMIKAIPGKIRAMAASTAAWFTGIRTGTMSARVGFASMWTSFKLHGAAAISVIAAGVKTLGATLWTAIGGLPGLLITGVTMGLGYWYSKNEELKNAMKQTADELQDRYKQLSDFLKENDASKAIAEGDSKAIDNMIDEYKEKIKQIAPYNYNNLVMKAEERKSHEERLRYLADELELLQKSNKISQEKLSDNGMYKELKDALMRSSEAFDSIDKTASGLMAGGADKDTARKKAFGLSLDMEATTENLKKEIEKAFGDISKDRTALEAAKLSMSNIFAQMGISEERANEIRASVLQAFGVTDGWLESQVGSEMRQMIDNVAPEIAMKIRSGQKLNEAETKKVKELMDDAKRNLTLKYPEFETTLQRLLAASRFTAVIDLVVNDAGKYGDVQGTMAKRMPKFSLVEKSKRDQYMNYVSTWGKQDSWYEARNSAKSEIDRLKNEYDAAKKSKSPKERLNWLKYQYDNAVSAALDLLNYDYKGEDKKSNKVPKGKGNNEDKELKAWEERLNAFKSARQMYQKYKGLPNWGAKKADDMVRGLFPEVGDLSFDKYLESLEKLEKALKPTTPERKKAITSLHRERSEWKYSEMLKPEADRLAADFAEILERGIRQADLHKALLEKTGDENFASLAFRDGMMWDDQTRGMAQMFEEMTGKKIDGLLDATDATAKKALEDNTDAYNLWKKITDLVRNNYTGYLEKAADAIKETATWEEKLLAVDAKWGESIKQADRRGDTSTAERFRQMRDKEKGQVMDAQFKQSQDYLNFFGAITEMGEMKAREVASEIRQHLNTALRDGSIDAREYAKQIQQIDEQLRKLSERRKGFFNGGIVGIAERKTEEGNAKISMGATSVAAGEEKIREGRIKGDIGLVGEGLKLKMTGEDLIRTGKKLVGEGMTLKKRFENIGSALGEIANIANGISDAFNQVKDMADALGIDTESDGWQDAQAVMSSLGSITGGISKTFNAVKSGDIGGAVSGVASIITGPITAFAKAHDAKKERQIKLAERELKALENMQTTIKNAIEDSLGGIYNYRMDAKTTAKMNKIVSSYENGEKSNIMRIAGINPSAYSKETYEAAQKSLADPTNAYQAELTGLMAQRDQLQRQRANEDAKKKTDKDKLADYDQQIEEMERSIKNAAKNFLKELYGVDMKSWASQLTDAVVSAWEKGEDAIDAYKKKTKEMVKDLTKNIISQKIMEQALQKPLDFLTQQIEKKGRLDEYDVTQLASDLYSAGENSVANITAVLEELKRRGWDFSESGSSSATNTIKGVTEETADLLAAYLNAIRLDVSVNRENIKAIATNVSLLPAMSEIQKSQLAAMNQLVTLAQVRNDRIDEIVAWTRKVSNGSSKIYVK